MVGTFFYLAQAATRRLDFAVMSVGGIQISAHFIHGKRTQTMRLRLTVLPLRTGVPYQILCLRQRRHQSKLRLLRITEMRATTVRIADINSRVD
jgi:hypothetical protein